MAHQSIRLALIFLAQILALAAVPAWAQPAARATVIWTQEITAPDGAPGYATTGTPVLIDGEDVVIALVEPDSKGGPSRAWLERRGPKGLLWRQALEGLPAFPLTLQTALSSADANGRAVLAIAFHAEKEMPAGGEFGRLVSIDLATGAIDRATSVAYPRVPGHGKPQYDDAIHLVGIMRLGGGQLLLFGGDGTGPYRWWAGLRQGDGGFLWDSGAAQRGYGDVREARETKDGVELLIYGIASRLNYGDANLLVRLDRAGRMVSRVDLGSTGRSLFWLEGKDGLGMLTLEGQRQFLSLRDAKGAERRFGPPLPSSARLESRIGPWLILTGDARRYWMVSTEGGQIGFPDGIAVAEDGEGSFHLDGAGKRPVKMVLRKKCLEPTDVWLCRRQQFSLVRIDF